MNIVRRLVLLVTAALSLAAQNPLAGLRTTLTTLRAQHPDAYREVRGATALLTTAKHQLRDWIESRLADFPVDGDADHSELESALNETLEGEGLFCDDYTRCILTSIGAVDVVRVKRERELLVILTSTGIRCGFDDSAYVYQPRSASPAAPLKWTRVWEWEQNSYTEAGYLPQALHGVRVSPIDDSGKHLVLTMGTKPGCSAAFQPAYVRLFRSLFDGTSGNQLLDYQELISVDGDTPVRGRVSWNEARVGFTVGGTGYGYSHRAIRHFVVRGDKVERIGPIATTPRDFVEEWLAAPWAESAGRSTVPSDGSGLEPWHIRLHRDDGMGNFPEPAVRCADESWMIATHLRDAPTYYFRVRLSGPDFNYSMSAISDMRFADCTRPDPDADRQPDLFR